MHQYESIGGDSERGLSSSGPSSSSSASGRSVRLAMVCFGVLALVALIGFANSGPPVAMAPTSVASMSPRVESDSVNPVNGMSLVQKDDKDDKESYKNVCVDPNYTKVTLKTATESTMVALFDDLHGEKKFEASDVIPVGNDFLVVFDNLYRIGRIDQNLAFRSPMHQLVPSSPARGGDSGFEALVWVHDHESAEGGTLYVVVEAEEGKKDPFHHAAMDASAKEGESDKHRKHKHSKKSKKAEKEREQEALEAAEAAERDTEKQTQFHAIIEEIAMPGLFADPTKTVSTKGGKKEEGYTVKARCPCEYSFTSGNKGFEGAVHLHFNGADSDDDQLPEGESKKKGAADKEKVLVMMGLCEGNHCEGGERGREVGNGRVVLMVKSVSNETNECVWKTVNLLALPPTAAFSDYSAIAIIGATDAKTGRPLPNQYTLAVTSQESSQVWIGRLRTGKAADFSDWSLTDGIVYNFPRSGSCEVEYCNIEGISFLDDNMLVAVSDKMKGGGRQHYRCLEKDQSVHTFVLP